jgi:predicted N-formylglutamate amidohydrolase
MQRTSAGQTNLVVSCEHGGNRVPAPYARLFHDRGALLESHRGYDFGARDVARALARRFDAPLHCATVTRLLVELNRSPGHLRLFSTVVRGLLDEEREAILATYYHPYRQLVEGSVRSRMIAGARVLHLSVHSFTPRLAGRTRNADVGLLYDPRRQAERALCDRWRGALVALDPALRVRRNYPYRGDADGLTTFLRKRLGVRYLGIELEMNQARLDSESARTAMAVLAAKSLAACPW